MPNCTRTFQLYCPHWLDRLCNALLLLAGAALIELLLLLLEPNSGIAALLILIPLALMGVLDQLIPDPRLARIRNGEAVLRRGVLFQVSIKNIGDYRHPVPGYFFCLRTVDPAYSKSEFQVEKALYREFLTQCAGEVARSFQRDLYARPYQCDCYLVELAVLPPDEKAAANSRDAQMQAVKVFYLEKQQGSCTLINHCKRPLKAAGSPLHRLLQSPAKSARHAHDVQWQQEQREGKIQRRIYEQKKAAKAAARRKAKRTKKRDKPGAKKHR